MTIEAGAVIEQKFVLSAPLGETGHSAVWAATDLDHGNQPVCLKFLKAEAFRGDPEAAWRFRREATAMARLSHPNVVKVRALGELGGGLYLVMDLVGGRSLDQILTERPMSIGTTLRVLEQVSSGLVYVHRSEVLHRDLKPANLLVTGTPESPTVMIIDFGFAGELGGTASGNNAVGTLHYMAPEQLGIIDRPTDARADLYAVGCIGYECIAGVPPFVADDPSALIAQVQSSQAKPLDELKPDTPPILQRVIAKLLSKNPDDRYQSAEGLLADISRIRQAFEAGQAVPVFELDQGSKTSLRGIGSIFVGRREELARTDRIVSELAEGNLHLLLVGGKSGAGKSAFTREACNRGRAHGLRFLRGKCYAMHTSLPYFAISEALNDCLRLLNEQPALRSSAAEGLRSYASDLVQLAPAWCELFPEAKPSPYQGEEADRRRLLAAVEAVIRLLATRDRPLAIFLDDLQWSDSSTIGLLLSLCETLKHAHVLFIGTYRTEEVGPNHVLQRLKKAAEAQTLPATSLEIGPLSVQDVGDLLDRLFGSRPREVIQRLHDRSGGNAFFVCELLRAYVQAGVIRVEGEGLRVDLDKLQTVVLPTDVVQVVLRRVDALSTQARKVLGLGALLGRAFNFAMLKVGLDLDEQTISAALAEAAAAQLIQETREGSVRSYVFAHDKILEASLNLVAGPDRSVMHRRIALELEREFNGTDEKLHELAYHFARSDDQEKALTYCLKAGDRAREQLANEQALGYYKQADDLLAARTVPVGDPRRIDLIVKRAEVLDTLGRYAEAEEGYRGALNLTKDPVTTARYLTKIAYGQQKSGRYDDSKASLIQALRTLGIRLFLTGIGPKVAVYWELLRYGLTRLRLAISPPREDAQPDARRALAIEIVTRLWVFYGMVDSAKMYYLAYRLFWLTLPFAGSKDLSNAHRILASTFCQGRRPRFEAATRNAYRSIEVARRLTAKMELATAYTYAGIIECLRARPREAIPYLEKGLEMLQTIGNLWDLVNAHIFLFRAKKALGKLDDAISHAQTILKIGEKADAKGSISSGCQKLGEVLILKGDRRNAFDYARRALKIAEDNKLTFDTYMSNKLIGMLLLREGKCAEARGHFAKSIAINEAPGSSLMRAFVYDTYIGWAEAVVRDEELKSLPADERANLVSQALRYLDDAVQMEHRYLNFLSYALRTRAKLHRVEGRHRAAAKDLAEASRVIEAEALPFEQAALLVDRAEISHAEQDLDEAERLLRQAREIYERVGASGEVARMDGLLAAWRPRQLQTNAEENSKIAVQLRSLIQVSEIINSTLDLKELGIKIVDEAVHLMGAERGFLLVESDPGAGFEIRVARDLAGASIDASTADLSFTVVQKVASDKKGIVVTDAMADERFAQKESVIASNLRSVLCAPLVHQDRLYGVLYLDNRLVRQLFDERDLDLVSSFAQQAAIAFSNVQAFGLLKDLNENLERKVTERTSELSQTNAALAKSLEDLTNTRLKLLEAQNRVMQGEMDLARRIQESILPAAGVIRRPGVALTGTLQPATDVGGDFWTFIPMPGNQTLLLIADVTGHGVGAGMLTTVAKSCCDTLVRLNSASDLELFMATLSDVIFDSAKGSLTMTAFGCIIDPSRRMLTYANAAHPPPYFIDASGGGPKLEMLLQRSMRMGESQGLKFEAKSRPIAPGDRLALYTDGLIECTNAQLEEYGPRRLRRLMQKALGLPLTQHLEALLQDAGQFFGDHPRDDDITLVLAEILSFENGA
jgi:eukaryotic-like serine/threonine-protein kinase